MSGFEETLRNNPALKMALIAIVPALLVFVVEELKPAPPPQMVERPAEPPLKHTFGKGDNDALTRLSNGAQSMLQDLDKNMSAVHTGNEPICLNGLRYGVYGYMASTLSRLQQDMNNSVHMVKAEDEKYINDNIMNTAAATLNVLPAMDNTITVMTMSCPGNGNVAGRANQIKGFLNAQVAPALKAIQAHGNAPKK